MYPACRRVGVEGWWWSGGGGGAFTGPRTLGRVWIGNKIGEVVGVEEVAKEIRNGST